MDDRARDKAMILDPYRWPQYPVLPVKRYTVNGGMPDFGCLVVGGQTRVLLTNLFAFDPVAPALEYESVDALLADGWRVD